MPDALDNHPREWRELGDTYWNHPDFVSLIEKKAVKPSDAGAVTRLRCEMDGRTIQVSAKVADDWKPVIDTTIADEKLRFFIFYGIRQFLRDNARKKKWGEGRFLELALEKSQVVYRLYGLTPAEIRLVEESASKPASTKL